MSQPSLDEATHYRVISHLGDDNVVHVTGEHYYKIGSETVYVWDKVAKGWMFTYATPERALSFSGITELRKPVISPVVEASDRLGRTGTMRDDIGDRHWVIAALNETQDKSPVYQTWATMKPEELQPIEEHGCTEEEVEEVNEALRDEDSELIDDVASKWDEYSAAKYTQFVKRAEDLKQYYGTDHNRESKHPNDKQVGGDHYKSMAVQPWVCFDDWLTKEQATGYYLASAIAYLARFNATGEGKGGLKDIQKAKHYLEKLESILLTNED